MDPIRLSAEAQRQIADRIPSYWPLVNNYEGFRLHHGPRQYLRDFTILALGNGPSEENFNPYPIHFYRPRFGANSRHLAASPEEEVAGLGSRLEATLGEAENNRVAIINELEANVRLSENCRRLELELQRLTASALNPLYPDIAGFRGSEASDEDQEFYRTPGTDVETELGSGSTSDVPALFGNNAEEQSAALVTQPVEAEAEPESEDLYGNSADERERSEEENSDSQDDNRDHEDTDITSGDTDSGSDDTDITSNPAGNGNEDAGSGTEDTDNDSGYMTEYSEDLESDSEGFEDSFWAGSGPVLPTGNDNGNESEQNFADNTADDAAEEYDRDSASSQVTGLESVQVPATSDEEGSEIWHDTQQTIDEERDHDFEDDLPDYETDSEYDRSIETSFHQVSSSMSRNEFGYVFEEGSGYETDDEYDYEYNYGYNDEYEFITGLGFESAESLPAYVSDDGLPGYESGGFMSSNEGYNSEQDDECEEESRECISGDEVNEDESVIETAHGVSSSHANFTLQLGQPGPSSERVEADRSRSKTVSELYEERQRRPNIPSYVTTPSAHNLSPIQKARFHGWSPKLWLGLPDEVTQYFPLPEELEAERAQYL